MNIDIVGSLTRTELIELARGIPWYHTIDFGDFVSEGEFEDFSPLLTAFGFPQDMFGMNVIDVGRASGFFAFEFERRGALVAATELPSPHEGKDYVGGARGREVVLAPYRDVIASMGGERLDYTVAHRLFESKVQSLRCSVYDICLDLSGTHSRENLRSRLLWQHSTTSCQPEVSPYRRPLHYEANNRQQRI